jgi:hypothetical protein
VNCSLVRHLIDGYLDNELSLHQRSGLEAHLASCATCSAELSGRASLDRTLRRALGAQVHSRVLPPAVSARIVAEAQASLPRAIRSHRAGLAVQALAGLAAVALVLVGLSSLLAHGPLPAALNPVRLLPAKQLFLAGRQVAEDAPIRELQPSDPAALAASPDGEDLGALSLLASSVDPDVMHPGDQFAITLLLQNDLPFSVDRVRFDLDLSGPTGYYRFPLSVRGPFPANVVSVIQITPAVLEAQCQERYLISPTEIFGIAGNYKLRFTLFSPGSGRE